jgi:outer membrane immunogenic protein
MGWGPLMKTLSLATVMAGTLLIANYSSLAADLAVEAPPIAPVFTWTGCYIGAHLGGGWSDDTVSVPSLLPGISVTGHTSGFLGGGQGGCNYQLGGSWLVGFEAEGSGADIKGNTT